MVNTFVDVRNVAILLMNDIESGFQMKIGLVAIWFVLFTHGTWSMAKFLEIEVFL